MQYFQKLIGKEGGGLGYSFQRSIPSHHPAQIWNLHEGKRKETGELALVFVYDPKSDPSGSKKRLAQGGLQRLKTFRHPDILKFVTSADGSDGSINVAAEFATPLAELLQQGKLDTAAIQWGLVCLSRAIAFLHQSGLIHGSLCPASIFVTPSGDWKLGAFESTQPHANAASLNQMVGLQMDQYKSPEVVRGMWSSLSSSPVHSIDAWALGCLIYAVHAGSLNSPDELRNINQIPKGLHPFYQSLLASSPEMRAQCVSLPEDPYFKRASFVELNLFLDNLAIKDSFEKEAFLKKLPGMIEKLPLDFCVNKVLPVLCSSIDMGIGGSPAFGTIVKLKERMADDDFKRKVVDPYAANWFSNASFPVQLRLEMLQSLRGFANLFDVKIMNEKVFPAFCIALSDQTSPALRDATVKTCVHIAPYLNERNLNGILMSKFAALQVDPEPAIRTNTTVCIGKLATQMSQATQQKVLIPAFVRALKDPFPPARSASLSALLQTQDFYGPVETAQKVYPAVAPLLVDPEAEVRTNAFKVLDALKPRLMKHHETLTARGKALKGQKEESQRTTTEADSSAWSLVTPFTRALLGGETAKPTGSSSAQTVSTSVASTAAVQMKPEAALQSATQSANGMSLSASDFGKDVNNDDDDDAWAEELDDLLDRAEQETAGMKLNEERADKKIWNDLARQPAGMGDQNQADLWDMLPMTQPKAVFSSGSSLSSRKTVQKKDDDWESILGGTGASKKRGPQKLGAVRR